MPKPKISQEDIRARRRRRHEWKEFREQNLFTQAKLAERLRVSLRTVQSTEGCETTPVPDTLRRFEQLKTLFDKERRRVNG